MHKTFESSAQLVLAPVLAEDKQEQATESISASTYPTPETGQNAVKHRSRMLARDKMTLSLFAVVVALLAYAITTKYLKHT